jgi:uroporphyrinogen III methyltransferase/synthase
VYDFLANREHLRHAKPGAKSVCVGKRFRYRGFSQDKINKLILSEARKGKIVVRLKGGDPYLFGRGGEEALYLYRHGIPFEVIPGVTSATACAAYAGIPLTHREHNAAVTFLTGHRAGDDDLDTVDWRRIAGLGGTLVIYMGFYNLEKIARRLVGEGMPASTKASVIEWGTLPRQRSCDGTLATIARRVKEKKLAAPCIIIIGEVVSLRRELNWFERLPLFGKRIVVTRATDKAGRLFESLSELGADVIEFPTIEVHPPISLKVLDAAIAGISRYDWVVFTSTVGCDAFFGRLAALKKDARALSDVRFACVGPDTAAALLRQGIKTDLAPRKFESSALVEEFARRFKTLKGERILIPRPDIAPPGLEQGLANLGAAVMRITAYRTRPPRSVDAELKERLRAGAVDFVTFTSASTAVNFTKILGAAKSKALSRRAAFVSIGPVTSAAMKKCGLRVACEAKESTIDGLVAALQVHAKRKTK